MKKRKESFAKSLAVGLCVFAALLAGCLILV